MFPKVSIDFFSGCQSWLYCSSDAQPCKPAHAGVADSGVAAGRANSERWSVAPTARQGWRAAQIILLSTIALLGTLSLKAQCPNDNTAFSSINIAACPGTGSVTCLWGGEYTTLNVIAGNRYVISTCGDPDFDTQLTLYNHVTGALLGYNDDACGLQSEIVYDAFVSGTIRIVLDRVHCTTQNTCITLNVSCTAIPAPINDEPCGAIPIRPGQRFVFNNYGATFSSAAPNPSCSMNNQQDVWFVLQMPAFPFDVSLDNLDGLDSVRITLYTNTGGCNGTLQELSCNIGGFGYVQLPVLPVGTIVYVRISSLDLSMPFFNDVITFGAATTGQANDEPCGAIPLNPTTACQATQGSILASTLTNVPAPPCANAIVTDVWYSTVMPATGSSRIRLFGSGTLNNTGLAIYSAGAGGCNDVQTLLDCETGSNPDITITSAQVSPGTIFYIRIWGNDNIFYTGDFAICLTSNGAVNDEPCNSINVDVSSNCTYTVFSNVGASASQTSYSGLPAPGCGSYAGGDVWATVTMPAFGDLILHTGAGSLTDIAMAVYRINSGPCNTSATFALVSCIDNVGTQLMPSITIPHGAVPAGTRLYVRMYDNLNNSTGWWNFCAISRVCESVRPGGDNCNNATPICQTGMHFCTTTGAPFTPNTIGSAPFCGTIESNQYYRFVAAGTRVRMAFYGSNCTLGNGYQVALYTLANCTAPYSYGVAAPLSCINVGPNNVVFANYQGLTPGQTYYLMIDPIAGDQCGASIYVEYGIAEQPVIWTDNQSYCLGDTINLYVNGAVGPYSWSNATQGMQTQIIAQTPGTLNVAVTATASQSFCPATASVSLNVYAPTATITSNSPCIGQTLQLSGSVASYTYQWLGPNGWTATGQNPTRANFNNTMAGQYLVTITDGLGCSNFYSLLVNPAPSLTITGGPEFCAGQTLLLTASGASNYRWTTPSGTQVNSANLIRFNFNSAMAGLYTVTATSGLCSLSASINIILSSPTILLASNSPVCEGAALELSANGMNSFNWSGPAGFSVNNQATVQRDPARLSHAGTYSVTGTNANGCTSTAQLSVQVVAQPDIVLTASPVAICPGQGPVNIQAAIVNTANLNTCTVIRPCTPSGNSVASGSPQPGGLLFPFPSQAKARIQTIYLASQLQAQGLQAGGITRCQLFLTSKNSTAGFTGFSIKMACTNLNSFTAGQAFVPNLNLVFQGDVNTVLGFNTFDLIEGFYWDGVSNIIVEYCYDRASANLGDLCRFTSQASSVTITHLTNTSGTPGCDFTNAINISVNQPILYFQQCAPFLWDNGQAASSISVSPSATTQYQVTATNGYCSDTASISITVHPLPNIMASNSSPTCYGSSTQLQASGAASYAWIGPNAYSNTGPYPDVDDLDNTKAGTYWVTGTSPNGCTATASTDVVVRSCTEICGNGIDDDDDGLPDELDPDCPCRP